jgi:hypothetical protein
MMESDSVGNGRIKVLRLFRGNNGKSDSNSGYYKGTGVLNSDMTDINFKDGN